MNGIIWIASYPKSGNTWMRAFLANLIVGGPEPLPLSRITGFVIGEALAGWYRGAGVDPADNPAVARVRSFVQERLAKASERPIFLKTHNYLGEAHGHPLVNMASTQGAIYIVRNPLDVALSAQHHFDKSVDETIDLMARDDNITVASDHLVFEKLTDWSTHVKSWTQFENPQLAVLRYEDLLDSPEDTFGRVAQFLGLPVGQQQLRIAIENASFDALKKQEDADGFSEKPEHADKFFRVGRSGQWRDVLTDKQVGRIIERHYEQMKRFGYLPDGY